MKIKKAKFVVGSMLATCSLAIVGSITSTFAWYTYNTKTTLAYSGLAGGSTSNLQMKFDTEDDTKWRSNITLEELIAYSTGKKYAGSTLSPVTVANGVAKHGSSGSTDIINDNSFYGATAALNPKFRKDNTYDADGNRLWVSAKIEFRCIDPNDATKFYAKPIYVSYLGAKVNEDSPEGKDITQGLRVSFARGNAESWLVAPGYVEDGSTTLYGPLNLSGSDEDWGVWTDVDTETYEGEDFVDQTYCKAFMSKTAAQEWASSHETVDGVTFTAKEHYDVGIPNGDEYREYIPGYDDVKELKTVEYGNSNSAIEHFYGTNGFVSTFTNGKVTSAKAKLGTTPATSLGLTIDLIVFLEGWDPAVVDANYSAKFDLGIQFETELLDIK